MKLNLDLVPFLRPIYKCLNLSIISITLTIPAPLKEMASSIINPIDLALMAVIITMQINRTTKSFMLPNWYAHEVENGFENGKILTDPLIMLSFTKADSFVLLKYPRCPKQYLNTLQILSQNEIHS